MNRTPDTGRRHERRNFLKALASGAAAGAMGRVSDALAAEPPLETTRIRLPRVPVTCWAPAYVAEDLLKAEGFSEVAYVDYPDTAGQYPGLASGEIDIMMSYVAPSIAQIDAGNPLVVLGGVHPGCIELVASPQIRSVRDLKGKSIAVTAPNAPGHLFVAAFVGHVGLDPRRDINWVFHPVSKMPELLLAGKIDAFQVAPPAAQQMRARKVGHVIVNTSSDKPWSQYFCCVLTTNREFMRKRPVATKRAMRAILKGSHICAAEPEKVARQLVQSGVVKEYEFVLQGLREIPYGRWREYDAEDTVRYYALRLREAGFIKADANKIIANGTDWRFLKELKKELKV
jgi:NitT/TauT family transport system substrate-binding protein